MTASYGIIVTDGWPAKAAGTNKKLRKGGKTKYTTTGEMLCGRLKTWDVTDRGSGHVNEKPYPAI